MVWGIWIFSGSKTKEVIALSVSLLLASVLHYDSIDARNLTLCVDALQPLG